MKQIAGAALAAAMLAMAGQAQADPVNLARASAPNTYFNRPGADLATHDAELRECMAMAARTAQGGGYAYSPSLVGALVAAAVVAAMDSVENNHALRANAENCMVVRGWRVVALPEDQAAAIAKLAQPEQAQKLRDWVGAANPPGEVIRQWTNDAAVGATSKFEAGKLVGGAPDLSFTARDRSQDAKLPDPASTSIWTRYAGDAVPLKPGGFDKAAKDEAIVVVFVKGSGLHAGDTLEFRRVGTDPDTPPHKTDKLPDLLRAYDNWVWHKAGQWYAFAVPPGRWRIGALSEVGNNYELNFCLGAPSFEARAGDVIYAGTFDLSADYIGPDLTLDPAKAWLGAGPYADALKPAAYVNGARAQCGGTYIYDLEAKGAPYVDGYGWGGAIHATSTAAAPTPPTPATATASGAPPSPGAPAPVAAN
ncbi:MAG TPA: hypothetical protein VGF50_04260 [Caulobacteraceae bacterium]